MPAYVYRFNLKGDKKQKAILQNVLSFGKYRDNTYEEVKSSDISYCNWVLKQANTRGPMKDFQEWLKLHAKRITCEKCNGSGLGHMM
jgi:hypothetical protein